MRLLAPLVLWAVVGCPAGGSKPGIEPGSEPGSMIRGERETSAPLKSSAARPRPGAEPDHNPLEADRLGLGEARVRARRAHAESHSAAGLALDGFSHPACAGLSGRERRSCPLSAIRWSGLREVDGGVEMETTDPGVDATRLRWRFLCHIAFARSHHEDCPLGTPGLEVTVVRVEGRTRVQLVSRDREGVPGLRAGVRRIVVP